MRIEYDNRFSDILRFNDSHQFRSIALQTLVIIIVIFCVFSGLDYEDAEEKIATFPEMLVAGLYLYVALWVFQFVFNVFYLLSRKNKSVITRHVIEIQDESFYEETPYNRSYFYWGGVYKVTKIAGFIVVYVTPHTAHIIPNKAFESVAERKKFYDALMSKVKNA